ncbi:MAG: bifunctional tetrahydrofolate synthase/dihydrofolate synthase [Plesiomonas sp.]|uniref:bifunctional tetrahydrofolate synthase/dihydrofolate synthase n=1 Tax=Plesiomonas sp. TaxID=2486279 RepID=UPI003F326FE8
MKKQTPPQATSPLAAWLSYLESLHNTAIDLGLTRIQQVATTLGITKPAPTVITVAGTNGKGTTCRMLEVILMLAGYRVGVYSSPHLLRYTERVRIQGDELDEQLHSAAFSVIELGRGTTSLTYFEFSTLSALKLFTDAALDVVILEVGLGGRLDATNIVDSDVAVITSIDLDHTDWLGNSRESIGREKAGIFRANCPAVVGEPAMPESIAETANHLGTTLYRVGKEWTYSVSEIEHTSTWSWQCDDTQRNNLPVPQIPLPNAASALTALHLSHLVVSDDAICQGLLQAALPGRFQQVMQNPTVILDVAHNPHAARYLASRLQARPMHLAQGQVYAVVGMLADKDATGALQVLYPHIDHWLCATLTGPRGQQGHDLAKILSKIAVHDLSLQHQKMPRITPENHNRVTPSYVQVFDSVIQAWQTVLTTAQPQDVVIVFGSFYTVADVMAALNATPVHHAIHQES